MGAIQNSLNAVTSSTLKAAAGAVGRKLKEAQDEQIALQKQEQTFNTAMKQAELPVQQKEAKLEANEAKRQIDLFENKKIFQEEAHAQVEKKVNETIEKNGKITPKQRAKIEKEAVNEWKPVMEGFEKEINFRYDEQKGKLSQNVYKAQIKAKKAQGQLIAARLEQLRGGKK